MAEYRQLKESFWYSPFVLNLSPEERAFYVFMITNPATTQCGIYEISIKMIITLHGYNEEIIQELITKFVTWKKLAYDPDTHEFFVLNWMKHHRPSNQKIFGKVGKEVRATKSKTLQDLWTTKNPLDAEKIGQPKLNGTDTVAQPYPNGIGTVQVPLPNGTGTVQKTEFQKDINSSVPGFSSVVLQKEVGSSLLGLKAEEPEHKDSVSYDQGRELDHIDLSLKENQPGEERGVSFLNFNLKEEKQEPTPDKTPPSGSADPPPDNPLPPEEEIIRYMNQQLGTGYRLDSGSTRKLIQKKLAEGFQVLDFRTVIDKKKKDWKNPPFRSNLIPHVLFGDHFEEYLQQEPRVEKGSTSYGQRTPISTFTNHTTAIREVF